MTINSKMTIRAKRTYTREECCDIFGRQNKKPTFEYFKYRRGANFILGPGTQRQPWNKKYYISGADLYRFVRGWRPNFIQLLHFKDE